MLAIAVKSDLEIPDQIARFFSLYLLIAIGFHGGYELSNSGWHFYIVKVLLIAILFAIFVPLYTFVFLKEKLNLADAVATAATYGSISAVTFITAISFLNNLNQDYGGYMVAAMALMESPAIIVSLILYSYYRKKAEDAARPEQFTVSTFTIFKESFFNSSIYLLLGSLMIGLLTGQKGWLAVKPFFGDLFKGALTFFLLDMGIVAAKRLYVLRRIGFILVVFAIIVPLINAALSIFVSKVFALHLGDALLLCVLCASASYIAVPAAMRIALPQANPSVWGTMSLAVTFPFNIIIGIPLYYEVLKLVLGG